MFSVLRGEGYLTVGSVPLWSLQQSYLLCLPARMAQSNSARESGVVFASRLSVLQNGSQGDCFREVESTGDEFASKGEFEAHGDPHESLLILRLVQGLLRNSRNWAHGSRRCWRCAL